MQYSKGGTASSRGDACCVCHGLLCIVVLQQWQNPLEAWDEFLPHTTGRQVKVAWPFTLPEGKQAGALSALNKKIQISSNVLPNERTLASCVEQELNQNCFRWRNSPCFASLQQYGVKVAPIVETDVTREGAVVDAGVESCRTDVFVGTPLLMSYRDVRCSPCIGGIAGFCIAGNIGEMVAFAAAKT
ncbi:hypothetical protein HPB51_026402 [Rhipicephalus microplus]|uniref:Uncharacterized protein n=1 Tax=Rhipicephalus microplus TaxID=6941 RepID=A0A9J6D2Q1_RHIMP|nr:hypothetical protein HPB51_026402 [Rhipicephalus microplus]